MTELQITTPYPVECITAYDLTYNPLYRIAQFYQAIILILAIFSLAFFLKCKLWKSTFHGNLKCIFYGYFGSVLLFSVVFGILTVIQLIIPLISSYKCDLLINRKLFKVGNIFAAFTMALAMIFPMSITIERIYASRNAENYEKMGILLGPVLCVFSVIIDISIIYLIYQNDDFDRYTSISFVLFPPNVANNIYIMFWVLLVVNSFNVVANFLLLRVNSDFNRINSTLTTKYQLEEVNLSTKFAITVIFVHVALFGVYVLATMTSRYFGGLVFKDPIVFSAIRGVVLTMIATYNLAVGIAAVYRYEQIWKAKKSNSIEMKSTGSEGARNYDQAIYNLWNSVSTTKN